jgi:serine/threonine protein kinase
MKLAYYGTTGEEGLCCVAFYGLTLLRSGPAQGLFLVFELASGGTIDSYIEQNAASLDWNGILEFCSGIASGLDALHGRGISHGFELSSQS